MADRSVVVRLRSEVDSYIAGMKRAQSATSEFGREVSGRGRTAKADLEQVGRGALLLSAGMAAGLGLSAKAAIDWESAWAGVSKTVDGSVAEMADLEGGLRDLAKTLPATHGEIAAVAEAAGQLGIQRGAIEGFTKTMIDLGETTNLTADQAATSLARMSNIMGTPQADIERMASTLVALGNAGASTESEILDMAMRIAGAAKQVGISEAATLGFANALSSVGVEAEAGGTAISRVFSTIASSVADGGASLDEFARIAGMSGSEFRTAFEDDAAGATIAFVEGLDRIKGSGENVFGVLEGLELGDIRVRDALLRASSAGDLFSESLALGADEWERNNALTTEAEKRYETTAAKLEVARNQAVDLAIDLGGALAPALTTVAGGASTMIRGFDAMPDTLKTVGVGITGVATAGIGMAGAAAVVIPKIAAMRATLVGMGTAGRAASAAMPWLAAAAAAIGAVSFVFGQQAQEAEEAEARIKGYTDAIREAGDATDGTKQQINAMLADAPAFARILDNAGVSADQLGEALAGSDAGWEAMRGQLLGAAEDAGVSGIAFDGLGTILNRQREEALLGAEEAETLGRVMGDTGDAAGAAASEMVRMADGTILSGEAAEEARTQFEDLMDAYRAAVDPLFAMLDALDANRDAHAALSDAIAANTDDVDDNNVSVEEMDRLYRDLAMSAPAPPPAARTLNQEIATGNVTLDQAHAMLREWVAQGSLTEEQALRVAEQFGHAADEGARIAPEYRTTVTVDASNAFVELDRLARRINAMPGNVRISIGGGGGIPLASGGVVPQHLAAGGAVYLAAGGGPRGTDTVPAWLTPGEFVVNARSAQQVGYGALDRLNSGTMSAGSSSSGGVTIINQVSVNAGNIVGDHSELVRVVKRGLDEAARLNAA